VANVSVVKMVLRAVTKKEEEEEEVF